MQQIKGYFILWRILRRWALFLFYNPEKRKKSGGLPDNISNILKYYYNVNNFIAKLTIFCVLHNLEKDFSLGFAD